MGFEIGAALLAETAAESIVADAFIAESFALGAAETIGVSELALGAGEALAATATAGEFLGSAETVGAFTGSLGGYGIEAANTLATTSVSELASAAVSSIPVDAAASAITAASETLTAKEVLQGIKYGVDAYGTLQKLDAQGKTMINTNPNQGSTRFGSIPSGGLILTTDSTGKNLTPVNPVSAQPAETLPDSNMLILAAVLILGVYLLKEK